MRTLTKRVSYRRITRIGALSALVLVGPVVGAQGQATPLPVTLVVAYNFPYKNADAVILQRPSDQKNDLVVIDFNKMHASLIGQAVMMFEAIEHQATRDPRERIIRVPEPTRANKYIAPASGWALALLASQPVQVPGVGKALMITVTPP